MVCDAKLQLVLVFCVKKGVGSRFSPGTFGFWFLDFFFGPNLHTLAS